MKLINYRNPLGRELETLNRIFDHAFPGLAGASPRSTGPAVDLWQTEGGYRLEVELPGFSREAIQLEVEDGVLTIKAHYDAEGQEGQKVNRSVNREIQLPDDVAREGIEARLEHGILTLTLPRREELKPARIEIR